MVSIIIIYYLYEDRKERTVTPDHHSISLVMPNGDPTYFSIHPHTPNRFFTILPITYQ